MYYSGTWDDHGDFEPFGIACQTQCLPPTTTPTTVATCANCPPGYTAFENACYLITGNSSNFAGAQNYCQANGGHLVFIHDNATNYFIQSQLVRQPNIIGYWIGLTCNETNGIGNNSVCSWLDGTPYNYQDWQAGGTDGASGGAACANNNCLVTMYYSGTWDDHGDFEPFGIACQTQCLPPTTTPTTVATCANCPPGYTGFENACYLITGNSSNFAGARNYCQANGGDLVSIHDNATNYFIQSQLVHQSNIIGYWIGLTCNETNGIGNNSVCSWLDGTSYNYQDWQAGGTDGASGGAACANNNCLVTMYYSGTWDDHGDFEPFGIACQTPCKPAITTTTPARTTTTTKALTTTSTASCPTCPNGWKSFENVCYLVTSNSSNFAGARNYCQAKGGDLVSIHDNATNYFIQSQLVRQPNIIGYWIGLTCNETNGIGNKSVCSWLDGTRYNYQDWQAGGPDGASGGAACANNNCLVTMYYSGTWDDHGDFEPFGIVCQRSCNPTTTPVPTTPPLGTCPASAGYYWGNCNYALNILLGIDSKTCYKFYGSDVVDFYTAEENCANNINGHLASISDVFANANLASTLKQILLDPQTPIWLGGNRVNNAWTWTDGKPFSYANWEKGEPKNGNNCTYINPSGGKWLSADCSQPKPYLCEIPVNNDQSPTCSTCVCPTQSICPTQSPITVACDSGWTYYKNSNSCYKVHVENLTWTDAQQVCINQGSNLTSIHSADENQFIISITRTGMNVYDVGEPWIGLNALEDDINFSWVDGTPLNYTNWGPNRPATPISTFPVCYITSDNLIDYPDLDGQDWVNTPISMIHRAFV
uniref:C-type lectin domain-containing protein n=1 Tax=Acrobeloides nanus TaxID=290746 RepID=A0A914CNQ2_9BILA